MKDVILMYSDGEKVATSAGRGPGYRGCLNDFDRAMIGMIHEVRSVHVLEVSTVF